jgi:ferredoxin-type protein NapH
VRMGVSVRIFAGHRGKARTCRWELPAWTSHTRYVVLVGAVLLVPFLMGEGSPLFICRVCPAGALEAAVPLKIQQTLANEASNSINNIKIAVTVFVVAGMFLKYRPWCTLLCPLGAIFGLFNRWSVMFLRFNPKKCTSCNLCHKQCHVGLKPNQRANDPRCIRCLECTKCGALMVGSPLKEPAETKQ